MWIHERIINEIKFAYIDWRYLSKGQTGAKRSDVTQAPNHFNDLFLFPRVHTRMEIKLATPLIGVGRHCVVLSKNGSRLPDLYTNIKFK
jgi:hypothetical protein